MTKPTLETLEAMALRNRLDLMVLQGKTSPPEARRFYEQQMKPIADRYKELTGFDYVFIERREID